MLRHFHTIPRCRLLREAPPLRVDWLSEFFREICQLLQISPCTRYVLRVSMAERILEDRQAFSGPPEFVQRFSGYRAVKPSLPNVEAGRANHFADCCPGRGKRVLLRRRPLVTKPARLGFFIGDCMTLHS